MIFRKLKAFDAISLYTLFAAEKAVSYMDLPLASLAMFERWLNELMAVQFLGLAQARIILTDQRDVAGFILLHSIDQQTKTAEMGTWIGCDYRGKGFNEKAKAYMLRKAFTQLGLETVLLVTAEANIASRKALEKLSYVSLAHPDHYRQELKHKEFLYRQKFLLYEAKKELFPL